MSRVSVYARDNCDCEEASGLRSTYWTHRAETTQQWEIWHKLLGINEFPRRWECKRGGGGDFISRGGTLAGCRPRDVRRIGNRGRDLLAIAAPDLEDRLSGCPLLRRLSPPFGVIALAPLLWRHPGARPRRSVATSALLVTEAILGESIRSPGA